MRDVTGREIKVGDKFAYASRNHWPYVTVGEVLKVTDNSVKVRVDVTGAYGDARVPYKTTYTFSKRIVITS